LAVRERPGSTAKTKQQREKSGAGRAKVGPEKGSQERIRLSTSITHEVWHPSWPVCCSTIFSQNQRNWAMAQN